jgi:hypothetical protein
MFGAGQRDGEYTVSSGPTYGGFVTIAQMGRCRTSRLQDTGVQEYRLPSPPSFKCHLPVLRENLSVDSQNIPCATLKRRVSWLVGNLCISLIHSPVQQ